ncbi:hypothetical protein GQ457_05G022670 [Hibiscus cannabinus]
MTGFRVNVGEILANELAALCKSDKGILAFPCLISALCRRVNTPMFDTDKYQAEKTDWTRAVYMRKMNVADAEPLNMVMPTPPASLVHEADARVEDSAPSSPTQPSAAAELNRTLPPSPPVIPVSSHTITTSPATTPAAPAEQPRGRTTETPLGFTPSSPAPSPSAPAQSEEAGSLQYMLLRSQLQRIEARQLHFQNKVKVFQDTLTKFLLFQFLASATFFGQSSTPPPQPSASAGAAAQPSTHTSAKEGATEEVHFSSDDENDVFDWQSPRDHLLALGPSISTPAPAAPILYAAPTPTTAAAINRPTPDSPQGSEARPLREEPLTRAFHPAQKRRRQNSALPSAEEYTMSSLLRVMKMALQLHQQTKQAHQPQQTPPASPPVVPISSHTTTTSPATTPAAREQSRANTPDTHLGSTPSSSPSPPAPAQSEEATPPLHIMLLRSQLQRIEARHIHFQEEMKVFNANLLKFLHFQFPAAAHFFAQPSATPPQPNVSTAAQPSATASAKAGATEEVHFSSDDENDVFDWQSPRDHLQPLDPITTTPAPAVPILSAAPTPTTSAVAERPTPDSPARRKGKATAGRTFGRNIPSSPEDEANQRPSKRRRKYHVITADSDEEDSSAEIPVSKPMHSADPSFSSSI